ncbi:tRNA intron endonuclease [Amanita rubescens]|nr:tRNA intron endonuclease [Amanita rubescens]
MEEHPSYQVLSHIVSKYPQSAGSLFQAYNDIVYVQRWTDPEVIDLEKCERGVIKAKRKGAETPSYVVPCPLTENISLGWLHDAFAGLSTPQEIYLAITSDDASLVYYKISDGIVKPQL